MDDPLAQRACGSVEADTDLHHRSVVCRVGDGIALVPYLCHGLRRCAVQLTQVITTAIPRSSVDPSVGSLYIRVYTALILIIDYQCAISKCVGCVIGSCVGLLVHPTHLTPRWTGRLRPSV